MPKKQYRRRKEEDSDEEEIGNSLISETLSSSKELINIRKRSNGINAASLALGAKVSKVDELTFEKDPFKLKTGGLLNLKGVKDRNRDRSYEDVDRDVTNLGSTFSQETNRRDEDTQLKAYIEKEMKKLVPNNEDLNESVSSQKYISAEDKLYQLPDHLKIEVANGSEEMLSNQMLSGIPEVDLGIETKIKNIERTEEAKFKLITEMRKKKEEETSFVPVNIAVDYVQHKRYLHHTNDHKKTTKAETEEIPPLVVGDNKQRSPEHFNLKPKNNKSTDNYQ